MRRTFFAAAALLMSLPAAASITGTIMNIDGKPVGGAKVSLVAPETIAARRARYLSQEPARKPLASATSDAKGSFSVDAPKDQPFVELTVDAAGYAPTEMWLQSDEEAGAIVMTEAPAKNGSVKANGKPVANATVIWLSPTPVVAESVTTTDANGRYSVPDPSKWATRAIVFHPDFAPMEEDGTFANARGRGRGRGTQRDLSDTDLTVTPGVEVRGRVVADDGNGAANADVLLDHWPLAKTSADGTFVVPHAPKSWKVAEAYAAGRSAMRANAANPTLKLAKSASANGRLIDAKSQQPIAGAQVVITAAETMNGAQLITSSITDAKGNYSISPLVPGAYTLRVLRPGYGVVPQTISVAAGQSAQKTLYGTPHARLIGTVVDEDKRPVAAAHVTTAPAGRGSGGFMPMMRNNAPASAWSGPDGRFVARDVAGDEGSLIVSAAKKGFPPASTSAMKVAAGETKSGITLTIPRGIPFSGRVVDKDSKPVAGVEVDAMESTSNPGGIIRMIIGGRRGRSDESVRTAADGTFSMRVKEATYDFAFRHDGFAVKALRGEHVTAATRPVVVTLEPGVEITGRVTRGGAPIEGVNIGAISQNGFESAVTASDGTFRIGDLTPGQMMLNVMKADSFIQENRPVTAPAHDVNIDLPAGGRIVGHVIDKASGKPVTAFMAGVSLSRSGGGMVFALPPQLRQFTTDDGTFALDGVHPGPIELVVSAPGYTTSHTSNVEVEDGKATRDIEVSLDSGVKVSGRVTDSNGQPVAGVAVRNAQSGGGRMMRFDPTDTGTATDPNGEYTLDAQEAGQKTFSFTRSGYVSEERSVNLTGKEFRLDVQLSSGLQVTGVVVTDSGTALSDAMVHASSASDSTFGRQVQTDANGGFAFEGLAPGHYTFSASKSGFGTAVVRDVDVTMVNPVRITITSGATITGHVTGLSPDELQSAIVLASGSGTGNMQAPVDSSGSFRFDGAPTGTVRVSARTGAMFAGGKTSEPKTVVVDPGGSAQVDIDFKSTTVIRGRITRNGAPMASAMVGFRSTNPASQTSASTTSDSSGGYEVSGLDDGPYSVQVIDFDRLTPFSTTYAVKGSGNFDIDIKTVSVRGLAIDSTNNQPLNQVHVELRPTGGDNTIMSTRAVQTDSSGQFTLDDVARGAYQVTAEKEGYGHDVRPLTVTDTPPDDLQFSLTPSDGITLNVVDGRDGRQISAAVRAVDAQGHTYDAGDNLRFAGAGGGPAPIKIALAPGTYRVTVLSPGYAQKTISVSSPSTQTVPMTPGGMLLIHSKSSTPLVGRLTDANGLGYGVNPFGQGQFQIVPAPGTTTLQNIAPGTYRIDVLDASGQVVTSQPVTINEGQPTEISI